MQIQLDKNTKLGGDESNWIIYKKRPSDEWRATYFYSELEPLLHDYIQECGRTAGATKIEDLIDTIKNVEKRLQPLLAAFK